MTFLEFKIKAETKRLLIFERVTYKVWNHLLPEKDLKFGFSLCQILGSNSNDIY